MATAIQCHLHLDAVTFIGNIKTTYDLSMIVVTFMAHFDYSQLCGMDQTTDLFRRLCLIAHSSQICFYCASVLTNARYWYTTYVCLSITFRYGIETAQHIIVLSLAYGSPIFLVFPVLNSFVKFRRGHSLRGRWIYKFRIFLLPRPHRPDSIWQSRRVSQMLFPVNVKTSSAVKFMPAVTAANNGVP